MREGATRWALVVLLSFVGAVHCRGDHDTAEPTTPRGGAPGLARGRDAGNTDANADVVEPEFESVVFRTADGWTLHGDFRGQVNGPALLFVHQLGSNRTEWGPILRRLAQLRTPPSLLAIDLRGHGSSVQGPDGVTNWQSFGNTPARWRALSQDVAAGVNFLRQRASPNSLTIVASSIGSTAAILYAAGDPNVSGLVLLSPGLSYRSLDTRAAMTTYANSGRPALLVAGDGDTYSAQTAQTLQRLAPEGQFSLMLLAGTDAHGVSLADAPRSTLWDVLARNWLSPRTPPRTNTP